MIRFAHCACAVLLAGCATIERPPERYEVATDSLVKVGSAAALDAYAEANRRWFAHAKEVRQKRFCAIPENAREWACLPADQLRSNPELDRIMVTGSRISASDMITNNQESGVDEGDIVKKLGDRLFVLRNGKLHVIDLLVDGQPGLQLRDTLVVSTDDDDSTTWYDEILAAGDLLLLLGYNWKAAAAELSLFDVHPDGRLSHRLRYWVKARDYFSGSNYGARLEGEHLLMSLSLPLSHRTTRWPQWTRRDVEGEPWHSLLDAADVHLPLAVAQNPYLHTVLRCPLDALAAGSMDCEATGLIGSGEGEFYASSSAAYLSIAEWEPWVHEDPRFNLREIGWDPRLRHLRAYQHTLVYRVPFNDMTRLGVVRVEGTTGDQFSFAEMGDALFVTTQREFEDDQREVTLWHAATSTFAGSAETMAEAVATFPVGTAHRTVRFTTDALWLGTHGLALIEQSDSSGPPTLLRQSLGGGPLQTIVMDHSIDLIEPMEPSVLTSGMDEHGIWRLSLVDDRDTTTRAGDSVAVHGYVPSENRSHAFNAGRVDGRRVLGMPVIRSDEDEVWNVVSDLMLLELPRTGLRELGHVDMQQRVDCEVHCYDWYGNARVFFIDSRVFALSGGLMRELAAPAGGRLKEVGVVSLD